jgi:hypothetical protein
MAWPKGKKRETKTAGSGRAKGTTNKTTATLKEMILGALDKAGGQEYLYQQAMNNPGAFCTLIGKVLPTQVTGDDGGAVKHAITISFESVKK